MLKSDLFIVVYHIVSKHLKDKVSDNIIKQLSIDLTAVVMNEVNIADNINLSDQQIVDYITKQEYKPKVKPPQIDIEHLKNNLH